MDENQNNQIDIKPEVCSDTIENGQKPNKPNSLTLPQTYKLVPEVEKEKERESTIARKKVFLKIWETTLGSVKATCEKTGIGRTTYYDWMRDDKEFAKSVREYDEKFLEDLDQTGKLQILKGDSSMIRFYLDRRHPNFKQRTVTEVITGSKSLKELIEEDEEQLNDGDKKQSNTADESGTDRGGVENQGQARENGAVQTEPGAKVLLGKENEAKSDIESATKGAE